ncbi:MAG: hypothetical protein LBC68_10915 [Prevotellaceae bacterium]|jgi:septum formation topological specificity factor MinE|nr:hypothetical protein [Prevotellaceae bacterium]
MLIEIRNKKTEGGTSVGEFMQLRQELARVLADYLIKNDLVEFEFKRGDLIITIDVNLKSERKIKSG